MRMFWKEQTKLSEANPHAKKYHPMLIRFCLSLHAKSAAAYEELRSSKIMTLRNAVRPTAGFDPEVVQQLMESSREYTGYQRYVYRSKEALLYEPSCLYAIY